VELKRRGKGERMSVQGKKDDTRDHDGNWKLKHGKNPKHNIVE
jgi:hypothetical protein